MLDTYILPLNPQYQSDILAILEKQEPWHMIAYEALLTHGLYHSEHQWFGEFRNGELLGAIYHHHGLLHFVYENPPHQHSSLYSFISKHFIYFITHGKKELVEPIISGLSHYHVQLNEVSRYLHETPSTKNAVEMKLPWPAGLQIRTASLLDYQPLNQIFKNSAIEDLIDPSLVYTLILKRRVFIAERDHQILGSIMILKETPTYCLAGGLFVKTGHRKLGIASLLGQVLIKHIHQRGKKVCFYYSDQQLKDFYDRGLFSFIGKWVSYELTQKK